MSHSRESICDKNGLVPALALAERRRRCGKGKNNPAVVIRIAGAAAKFATSTSHNPLPSRAPIPHFDHPPSLHTSRDILDSRALVAPFHTNTTHHGDYRRQGATPLRYRLRQNSLLTRFAPQIKQIEDEMAKTQKNKATSYHLGTEPRQRKSQTTFD